MALDQQQYRQDCQSCSLLGGVIEESVWKKVPRYTLLQTWRVEILNLILSQIVLNLFSG